MFKANVMVGLKIKYQGGILQSRLILWFTASFYHLKQKPAPLFPLNLHLCFPSSRVKNVGTWKTKKHGLELLMWRGRNPVILTVDIKGDRPESSQFKTRTWVQSVLLLFSWPWPIITHRHSTGWITIRLKTWKLGYWRRSHFIWKINIWEHEGALKRWLSCLVKFFWSHGLHSSWRVLWCIWFHFPWLPCEYLLIKCNLCGLYSENCKWEILHRAFGRLASVLDEIPCRFSQLTYLGTRQWPGCVLEQRPSWLLSGSWVKAAHSQGEMSSACFSKALRKQD